MKKEKLRIELARAYDQTPTMEGYRVLVDRLWPRGVKKEDLKLDAWMKELAPSTELRRWYNHDPNRWNEFRKRYFAELDGQSEAIGQILDAAQGRPIILIFGAKDKRHNNAVSLKEYLLQSDN